MVSSKPSRPAGCVYIHPETDRLMIGRGSQHNDLPPEARPIRHGLAAGISGTLYALATVVSIMTLPPAPGSGPHEVHTYYVQHQATVDVTHIMGAAGSVFLLVFVASLSRWLLRVHRGSSSLTRLVSRAGVTVATMGLMTNAVAMSMGLNVARIEDGAMIKMLNDVSSAADILMSLPLSATVAFTSWALLRDHGAMRWIGLAGLLIAGLLVIRSL